MSGIGPQLPPHLQKSRTQSSESESESEDDQSYGPRLPSVACRGPKPEEGSSFDVLGPKLPPASSSSNIGPQLPPGFSKNDAEDSDSSDDGGMIGPMPPKPGQELTEAEAIKKSIEARAQKMLDKIEGRNQIAEPKRETWMLELPESKAKNFGLGPRQFSRSTAPKTKQDKSWTQAPNSSKNATENTEEDPEHDEDVLAYMASLERDKEMDKISSELKKKRGTETLMDIHDKKLKKKKKDKKEAEERKPFDRNTDLTFNRFDEAQKKAMIKKAAKLDSKFSTGAAKYL